MRSSFCLISLAMLLTSCANLPELYKAAEDIANDEAIEVTVSREAIQKKTDVLITIDIKNSDEKK